MKLSPPAISSSAYPERLWRQCPVKKPVILAGNAGYMGLFCHEKLEEAKSDNFCCRERGHKWGDDPAADIIESLKRIDTPEMEELKNSAVR